MPQIRELPAHVAELIAAGEVVERPASVVKELVENAMDAGATAIVVEIRGGGMQMIRITDNGCGIAPEELPTAFLRHATSKLRTEEELGSILTLGFRGEALAAISAVSRTEIVTRRPGDAVGARLRLEGGVPGAVESVGAPEGTTIRVCDLFYNTPARLKFMKKDSAETAAVSGLVQHLALSHPEISFQLIHDGQKTLHTPGDGKLESAIYAALGRDFAATLLPIHGRGGDAEVRGFITRPLHGRGSRGMQVFFLNGRFIKSQLLTAALEEGYRNQIMKGKFPGCVLSVTLPPSAVDVNVHPAKTQVKFAKEREVFDAVYHTVMDALDADGAALGKSAAPKMAVSETVNPRQDFFQTMDAKTFRSGAAVSGSGHPARPSVQKPAGNAPLPPLSGTAAERPAAAKIGPAWDTEQGGARRVADAVPAASFYQTKPAPPAPNAAAPVPKETPAQEAPKEKRPLPPAIPAMRSAAPEEKAQVPGQESLLPTVEAPWRIAGEVLHTYIICESQDGDLYLIDKHAAHERVNFDRLQKAETAVESQQLLQSIAAGLSREDGALLLENRELLSRFGFECEDFGGDTVLVRAVPADIDAADAVATLEEAAQQLRSGRSLTERRENLLHTMACKAAIKAGMHSDEQELRVLVERVQRGEIKYCPHGRPVAVKVTKYELEKLFKRA